MTPLQVWLLWVYALQFLLIICLVVSTADERSNCRDWLDVGLAMDPEIQPEFESVIQGLECLSYTFLDIHNITCLRQYYLSISQEDLSMMYLYSEDCHYLAIIASSLALLGGRPVIAVATPSVVCPPVYNDTVISFGPDWSQLVNIIQGVVKYEEARHVLLLHGPKGFPYRDELQLKLSSSGITLTTYTIDQYKEEIGPKLILSLCCDKCINGSCSEGTIDSILVIVAVFENYNNSATFLNEYDVPVTKRVLWFLPMTTSEGLTNHPGLSPNVYFIVPENSEVMDPKSTLVTVLDSVLERLNSSDFYSLYNEMAFSARFVARGNCSEEETPNRETILRRILKDYFPYEIIGHGDLAYFTEFSLQHVIKSGPSDGGAGKESYPKFTTASDSERQGNVGHSDREYVYHGKNRTSDNVTVEISGTWSRKFGLNVTSRDSLYVFNSQGYRGGKLVIGTVMAAPYTIKDENNSWTGFAVDLTIEMMQNIGISYEIIESFDGQFGTEYPNGTWNGLIRMAQLQQIDLAIGPISLTPERAAIVDYVQPVMEDGGGIIVKKVEDRIDNLFSNFRPFQPVVWTTLFAITGAVAIVFAAVNHFSPYRAAFKDIQNMNENCIENARDSVWIIFSSYFDQGVNLFPYNVSGRLILGCWWVFAILVLASYTGELAARLTLSLAKQPIETLADLAEQTSIKPIAKQGTVWYSMIQKGETETLRKLRELMKQAPKITAAQEGVDLVMKGGYALITDYSQLGAYRKNDCDNLVLGKEIFNMSGIAFFVPNGSPWRRKFDAIITQMHESGIIEKYRQKWWSLTTQCPEVEKLIFQSQGLDSTGAQYIIMAAVMLLAIVTAFFERLWYRFRGNKNSADISSIEENPATQAEAIYSVTDHHLGGMEHYELAELHHGVNHENVESSDSELDAEYSYTSDAKLQSNYPSQRTLQTLVISVASSELTLHDIESPCVDNYEAPEEMEDDIRGTSEFTLNELPQERSPIRRRDSTLTNCTETGSPTSQGGFRETDLLQESSPISRSESTLTKCTETSSLTSQREFRETDSLQEGSPTSRRDSTLTKCTETGSSIPENGFKETESPQENSLSSSSDSTLTESVEGDSPPCQNELTLSESWKEKPSAQVTFTEPRLENSHDGQMGTTFTDVPQEIWHIECLEEENEEREGLHGEDNSAFENS